MTDPLGYRLGIDFGTTHTAATLGRPDGRPQSLLFDGSPLLSSAVYGDRDGRLLTGRDALRAARLDPARFEPNPKRRVDEQSVLLGDREYPVVELIAAVLRRAYVEGVRVAGGPLGPVGLTYPAGWAATRRGVLAAAAERAGFQPVLTPEPLAAALYFARQHPGDALVVYDFGAGTFDVSVLGRGPGGGWLVLATAGLPDLGGLDLDAAITAHLRLPASRAVQDEVRAAKEQLSRTSTAVIRVPETGTDVHLTREEFERLARPLLDQTVQLTAQTLATARVPAHRVALLLVGGSSRIPLVATLLHRALGVAPIVLDQPELVVAEGAVPAGLAPADPRPAPLAAAPMSPPMAPPLSAPMAPPMAGPVAAPGYPAPGPARPRRRGLVPLAILLVLALAVASTLAIWRPWQHPKRITANLPGLARTHQPSLPPSPTPSPSTTAYTVVYTVTVSGSGNTGGVTYYDEDDQQIRRSGIPLPWQYSFTVHRRTHLLLFAQRQGGGDNGPVTCTITVNGKTVSTTTLTGRSAAPECSGIFA